MTDATPGGETSPETPVPARSERAQSLPAITEPADNAQPTFAEAMSAAAHKSAFGLVEPGETPTAGALLGAMGGIRGIIESVLPGFVFVLVFAITTEVAPSVLIPGGIAVIFVLIRLFTRSPVVPAIIGLLGIAISAALAIFSGRAEENFLLGFFLNAGYVVALLISIAVRWPIIGIIVGFLRGEGSTWRQDKAKYRVALIATFLWVGLFGLRLLVQLPLYYAGAVQALGAAKLIMGLPFYACVLWITWLLVRAAYARQPGVVPAEDESAQ